MRKVKFRTMKELYGGTKEEFEEPTKHSYQGSFVNGKQFDRHFSSCTFQMGEESRTCNYLKSRFQKEEGCSKSNVSTTPCSSCMHLEQVASLMDTKANEFSDETTCKEKAVLGSYISDAEMLSPSSSSGCNSVQHASSEMSNIFSVCSSRDSFSESIESQSALKFMDVSENIEMLVNHKYGFPKPQIVYPQTYSNHLQKQKELEGLGDNISCISRSDDTKTRAGDMKNLSYTSALIDSSPTSREAIHDQFDFHYRDSSHFDKVTTNHPGRPNRESSQAVADFSNRSDQSEISSIRDFFGSASWLKGEPSDYSKEQWNHH